MLSARLSQFVRTQNQRNATQCSGSHSEPLRRVLRLDLLLLCFTCFAQGRWVSRLWTGSPHGFSLPATGSTLWILTGTATFVVASRIVFVECTERQFLFTWSFACSQLLTFLTRIFGIRLARGWCPDVFTFSTTCHTGWELAFAANLVQVSMGISVECTTWQFSSTWAFA